MKPLRAVVLVALATTTLTGCASFVAVGLGGVGAGAVIGAATATRPEARAVHVRMTPGRSITVVAHEREPATLHNVRTVIGRSVAEQGDTIVVALTELHTASLRRTFPQTPQYTVQLVRSDGIEVQSLSDRPRTKQRAVIGAIIGGAVVVFGALMALAGAT